MQHKYMQLLISTLGDAGDVWEEDGKQESVLQNNSHSTSDLSSQLAF